MEIHFPNTLLLTTFSPKHIHKIVFSKTNSNLRRPERMPSRKRLKRHLLSTFEFFSLLKLYTTIDLKREVSSRQPHNPKQILINQGVKPEPNYILLGEVERELKAVKERTKKGQIQQKTPQQLNVSNLLEELVSSKKWQVLTSSDHQIYGRNVKKHAPQAPTQRQRASNEEEYIKEFNRKSRILPSIPDPSDSNKVEVTSSIPKITQPSISKFDEEYLNASEIHKICQSDNKATYDSIREIPNHAHDSPVISSSFSHIFHTTSTTTSTIDKPMTSSNNSKQKIFSDNFFMQTKIVDPIREEMKSDDDVNATVKLLPSDIRKHRIWMSLNPGTKASQETALGYYDEVNQTQNSDISKPSSPWGCLTKHPFPKGTNQNGYKRFDNENGTFKNKRLHEKLLKKSNKVCGANYHVSSLWLATTVIVSICIGFASGFLIAWLGRSPS